MNWLNLILSVLTGGVLWGLGAIVSELSAMNRHLAKSARIAEEAETRAKIQAE